MKPQERMSAYLQAVESALDCALAPQESPWQSVREAMRYSLLGGGKRIRAVLVLEFCRLCGGAWQQALPYACAIEMVHAYSLIHDDLPCMDDDDLRRGKPSCHIAYGEAVALLAGDGLLTHAFLTAAQERGNGPAATADILQTLAQAAGTEGMIGGQVLDISGYGVDVETLTRLCTMKTGALIRAAAKIGCLAANASPEQLDAAQYYAHCLGLSFQITDDILDQTGDSALLGKPVGSDAANEKTTFASLLGIEEARTLSDRLLADGLKVLEPFRELDEFLPWLTAELSNRNK